MQNIWIELSKTMGCGGCSNNTTVESEHTCKTCGRMLCGSCGEFCKDHAPNKVLHADAASLSAPDDTTGAFDEACSGHGRCLHGK